MPLGLKNLKIANRKPNSKTGGFDRKNPKPNYATTLIIIGLNLICMKKIKCFNRL